MLQLLLKNRGSLMVTYIQLVILQRINLDVQQIILGDQHQSIVLDVRHIILDVQHIILDFRHIILDFRHIILDVLHQSIERDVCHTLIIVHRLLDGHLLVELRQLHLRDDLGFCHFDMGLHFQHGRYQYIWTLLQQFLQLDLWRHQIDHDKHN